MQKRHKKIKYIAVLLQYIFVSIIAPLFSLFPAQKVKAASTAPKAEEDTFVSTTTPYPNSGRRFMAIGSYYDGTNYAYFKRSRALIRFNLSNLPSDAIVTGVKLHVWHYGTNSGHDSVYVARLQNPWNESTVWNNQPYHTGNYGSAHFDPYNTIYWWQEAAERVITLDPSIIDDWKTYGNYGLMIRNYDESRPGVVICSRNIPSWPCNQGMEPKLEITYFLNQAPNQPNLDYPYDGWEIGPSANGVLTGVSCNTSGTGQGCDVTFRASGNDPDDTGTLTNVYEIRRDDGFSNDHTGIGEGWQTWTKNLPDGRWSWRGHSRDGYDDWGEYSTAKNFIVDTTAPTVPILDAEPEFSPGTQNEIVSNISTDSLIGGVKYEFQRADDPGFTTNVTSSNYVTTNTFTFSGLVDNQTYYYRARAKDKLDNVSSWSNIVSSTQDATDPTIDSLTVSENRISPINQDTIKDSSTIDIDASDLHLKEIKIEIIDTNTTNTVKTDTLSNITTQTATHSFSWDGKDDLGNYVSDGTYKVQVTVTDKAGNTTIDDTNYIIVDNTPADITINQTEGAWYNTNTINLTGQTESDATLEITHQELSTTRQITLDNRGIFNETFNLQDTVNTFTFHVTDITGNQRTETRHYFKEDVAPEVVTITPDNLTNNTTPTITVNLEDTGIVNGSDNYTSGINYDTLYLSITHPDTGELVLINNGINIQPTLGNITENCTTQTGSFGLSKAQNCTVTFNFTSNLQPDGNYTILARVNDVAGNQSNDKIENFELDSHIQNDITNPTDGSLQNFSLTTLTGTAEKGSTLDITVNDANGDGLTDSESFLIDTSSTTGRITVSNCRASANPTQDGIKEICDWEVKDFQLEKDNLNPGSITNNISFTLTDQAGNVDTKIVSVDVDVHAVNVSFNSDLEYFSPNGDGKQDSVEFLDMTTDGVVDTWQIEIKDILGQTVRTLSGTSNLPTNTVWDGRDEFGTFVADGDYTAVLSITTTDSLTFQTSPITLHAVTHLDTGIVITTPKNDSYTTRGAVTVAGIGPANTTAKICIDTIGLNGECNFSYETEINADNTFSLVVPLVRLSGNLTEHYLRAYAYDEYGNQTPESNRVKVTVTNKTPFESIQIIPALTGVNNEADYQIIIDKLDNGEEITQQDIDSLKSVVFRSTVNQGTERVKFRFSDITNLEELPDTISYNNIGWIDGNNQTHLYEEFEDNVTSYTQCNNTTCTWDFYYPIPPQNGGVFEVVFNGKLAESVEELSATLTIDANIPTAPLILDIDKKQASDYFNTNLFEGKYYTNSEVVVIKGVSDANANILIKEKGTTNTICTTVSSEIGFWQCEVDLFTIYSDLNTTKREINLEVLSTLGLNTTSSINDTFLIVDKIAPQFTDVSSNRQWYKSGDVIDISISANEKLDSSASVEGSTLGCINDPDINDLDTINLINNKTTVYSQNLSTDRLSSTGSHIIPGTALEGRFCNTLRITDLAGNIATQEVTYFIDDTVPDSGKIDTSTWGIYNGAKTSPGFIAKGRLVPEYVHEEDYVVISGLAEESQTVNLYVDGVNIQTTQALDRTTNLCIGSDSLDKIEDSVLVESGYLCPYAFVYRFDKGERGYLFQIKTVDRALNESLISEDELVYYDKTAPGMPIVTNISSASYSPIKDFVYNGNYGITKDLNTTLDLMAESLSDIEIEVKNPKGETSYIITNASGNGTLSNNIALGSIKDEGRTGCIQMNGRRRIGVCEDGMYQVTINSIDAAGNKSQGKVLQIERDTVAPSRPAISDIYMCGLNLCTKVSGEQGTTIFSNNKAVGEIHGQNQEITILYNWNYDKIYNFNFYIQDKALNKSQVVTKTFKTPPLPIGDGSSNGEDVFGTRTGNNLGEITMNITIHQNGEYEITDFNIPAPELIATTTDYNGQVAVYGIAIPKGTKIKAKITKEYMTKNEAIEYCKGISQTDEDEKNCINKKTGGNLYPSLKNKNIKCLPSSIISPLSSVFCLIQTNYQHNNYRVTEKKESLFELEHIFVIFQNKNDNTRYRRLGHIYNGNQDGKFIFSKETGKDLFIGDKIRAYALIFGSFDFEGIKIDYSGTTQALAFSSLGLKSGYSNEIVINERLDFWDTVVHPLIDDSCMMVNQDGKLVPGFQYIRGKSSFHSGVDLAKYGGCKINSIGYGKIKSISYDYTGGGNMIKINHGNGIESWYLHLENNSFYKSTQDLVEPGTRIAYMGNTGFKSEGTHLHLTLRINNVTVNPEDDSYLGSLKPDGKLYMYSKTM